MKPPPPKKPKKEPKAPPPPPVPPSPPIGATARHKPQLPSDQVRVCCAHEYTLSNLRFAQAVEPGNTDLTQYRAHCESLRAQGEPTLPSQLALERRINPFLRSREATVLRAVRAHAELSPDAGEADVFAALRQ